MREGKKSILVLFNAIGGGGNHLSARLCLIHNATGGYWKKMSKQQQEQNPLARAMNLSNIDLIERCLSKTSLKGVEDDCGEYAWIENVPKSLLFAINM